MEHQRRSSCMWRALTVASSPGQQGGCTAGSEPLLCKQGRQAEATESPWKQPRLYYSVRGDMELLVWPTASVAAGF